MDTDREARLTRIFRTLFNDPALVLRDDLTAGDVPGWDSFNHVNLIIQVEGEFAVRFSDEQIGGLNNVGDLKRLIESKCG